MISIIICSRNNDISNELKNNIAETIGYGYELVIIDNSLCNHTIFQAYNVGVQQAKGDLLCFCHDDVLFRSNDWGRAVCSHFERDSRLGVLGVAGSHFLPSTPMYWSSSPFISEHNLDNDNGNILEFFHDDFFLESHSVEVVAVDGLCFFIPRRLFDFIRFDEISYSGFHLYDMDICLQAISNGCSVKVCNDILIEHAWSESGSSSKKGYEILDENLLIFCNKWRDYLPISRGISLPDYSIDRIDRLYYSAYDAKRVRKSKAFRLGRIILGPLKLLFKKNDT